MSENDTSSSTASTGDFIVREAAASDLPEVLRVQHAAFRRVARRFGFPETDMAPLTETLPDLQALHAQRMRTLVAVVSSGAGERVIGTVRAVVRPDDVVEVGRLAVDDGFERRGVASALMLALETHNPDASRFELYTGSDATDALALYGRLGYHVFRAEPFENWTRVWLFKLAVDAAAPVDTRYTDTHDS